MSDDGIFSFEQMRASNAETFSEADYLHYLISSLAAGKDLVLVLSRLLAPDFVEVEGRILVTAIGAPEKYRGLRAQNRMPDEAQFWANLTEVSSLFGDTEFEQAEVLSEVIRACWQFALDRAGHVTSQRAVVVKEGDEQEVFVTLANAEFVAALGTSLQSRS